MPSFVEHIQTAVIHAGLPDAAFVSVLPDAAAFGDTVAVFRIGPFLFRFTRERGQAFVDLASQLDPLTFYQFDDVDVAMGWRSIDEVLAKREPEAIEAVLQRVSANFDALLDAFSEDREQLMRARIRKAALERGQSFAARLRAKL